MDGDKITSRPLSAKPIQFNEEFADSFLLGDRVNNKKPLSEQQRIENAASILSKNSSKNSFKNDVTNSGNVPFQHLVTSTHLALNPADQNNNNDKYQPRWQLLQRLKDSKPLIFDLDPPNDTSSDALTDEDEAPPDTTKTIGKHRQMTNRSFNTENLDQSRITHTLQNNPGNVRDLYQENEGFKTEVFSLKLRIYHMQKELDTFYDSGKDPRDRSFTNYVNENLTLKVEKGKLEDELEKFRSLLTNANACIQQIQEGQNAQLQAKQASEIHLHSDRANKLDSELRGLKHTHALVSNELETMKKDHSTFANLSQKVRDLSLECALAKNQRDTAMDKAKLLGDQNNRYEVNALAETQSKVTSLLKRVDQAEGALAGVENEKENLRRMYENRITDLQVQYQRVKLENGDNNKAQERLLLNTEKELNTERIKFDREKRLREALESKAGHERETLTTKDSVIESLAKSLAHTKSDNVVLNNKLSENTQEHGLLADRITSLQKQLALINSTSINTDHSDKLERKLNEATKKAKELALELSDKGILEGRLTRITEQFEKKSRYLGDLQRKYQVLLLSHGDSSSKVSQHELQSLQAKIKILNENIKGKDELIADLQKPVTPRRAQSRLSEKFIKNGHDSPSKPGSPYLKRENDLLKEQLNRARKMIRGLKINCQELIECTQLALASKENEPNYPLTRLNIDWQSKFDTLKQQITEKTPLTTPERPASIGNPTFGQNMDIAKRALFRSVDDVKTDEKDAEISRLKIRNSFLQKKLEVKSSSHQHQRSGLLTPPPERETNSEDRGFSSRVFTSKPTFDATKHKLTEGLIQLGALKNGNSRDQKKLSEYESLETSLTETKRLLEANFQPEKNIIKNRDEQHREQASLKMKSEYRQANRVHTNQFNSHTSGIGTTISSSGSSEHILKHQLTEAKLKLLKQEKALTKTMSKLAKSEKTKQAFEDKIRQQLDMTHKVLQQAKHNLED